MLLVAPWTVVWERNALAQTAPSWRSVVRMGVVRGAVSGLGLLSLGVGAWDFAFTVGSSPGRRRRAAPEAPAPSAPPVERALAEEAGPWLRKS